MAPFLGACNICYTLCCHHFSSPSTPTTPNSTPSTTQGHFCSLGGKKPDLSLSLSSISSGPHFVSQHLREVMGCKVKRKVSPCTCVRSINTLNIIPPRSGSQGSLFVLCPKFNLKASSSASSPVCCPVGHTHVLAVPSAHPLCPEQVHTAHPTCAPMPGSASLLDSAPRFNDILPTPVVWWCRSGFFFFTLNQRIKDLGCHCFHGALGSGSCRSPL